MAVKGFVYTLEAVIASAMILSMVLIVLPESKPEKSFDRTQLRSTLDSLEEKGDLNGNLSETEVEKMIAPYIPPDRNFTVSILNVSQKNGMLADTDSEYLQLNGSYSKLHLWIENASNMNISFRNGRLASKTDGDRYIEQYIGSTDGWLNTTGTGSVEYTLTSYRSQNLATRTSETTVINKIIVKNGLREVRVILY
ncbi:MAG: hypothetical protein ABEJ83_02805 [Candidatus Nanohaloarchaea archaeon]